MTPTEARVILDDAMATARPISFGLMRELADVANFVVESVNDYSGSEMAVRVTRVEALPPGANAISLPRSGGTG